MQLKTLLHKYTHTLTRLHTHRDLYHGDFEPYYIVVNIFLNNININRGIEPKTAACTLYKIIYTHDRIFLN